MWHVEDWLIFLFFCVYVSETTARKTYASDSLREG